MLGINHFEMFGFVLINKYILYKKDIKKVYSLQSNLVKSKKFSKEWWEKASIHAVLFFIYSSSVSDNLICGPIYFR